MPASPGDLIRSYKLGPRPSLLLAFVGCGARPTKRLERGVHRYYLITYVKLHRRGNGCPSEENLQSSVEKELDWWNGDHRSGVYCFSQAGADEAQERWGYVGPLTPDHSFAGEPFRAVISADLDGSAVRAEYDATCGAPYLRGVFTDGDFWPNAAEALRNIGITDMYWRSTSAASHLYNELFSRGENLTVEWG